MIRPKITIFKQMMMGSDKRYGYYSPDFKPIIKYAFKRGIKRPKPPTFDLSSKPSKYLYLKIRTEMELCKFIYNKWGSGIYMIFGHLKGRRGGWVFWKGEITNEGFMFFRKEYKVPNELVKLKKELEDAKTDEERSLIQDEINVEQEFIQDEKEFKQVRYGFIPFLFASSRRGDWCFWEDKDVGYEKKEEKEVNEVW